VFQNAGECYIITSSQIKHRGTDSIPRQKDLMIANGVTAEPAVKSVLATRGLILARGGRTFAAVPDLDVARGRSLAILGASGSGKSTALMALAGIRPPAGGEIVVADVAIWRLPTPRRDRYRGERIGLVFQSFHIIDAVSVAANLDLARRCAGLPRDKKRVIELLQRLGLGELGGRRADRLSHGQAQRLAVARALVNLPAVVLADEPTSALDDANAKNLLALLKEAAAAEGAALVIATHDRRVIDAVDSTVEMKALP
jgi:putative ABC transport system ATP-binding protein